MTAQVLCYIKKTQFKDYQGRIGTLQNESQSRFQRLKVIDDSVDLSCIDRKQKTN